MSDIPDGQMDTIDEIARLKAELADAREVLGEIAYDPVDVHGYVDTLRDKARDFLAKYPEEP